MRGGSCRQDTHLMQGVRVLAVVSGHHTIERHHDVVTVDRAAVVTVYRTANLVAELTLVTEIMLGKMD